MILGIIDVGTNSIHLLVGRLSRTGAFRVIHQEHALIRLGDGGCAAGPALSRGGAGRLTRPAMRRALAGLARYAATLRRLRVERVEAVATSAVREAANGRAFARRVRSQLGIPLRVISGLEEARLAYLGVVQAQRARQPAAFIAIGGGSAQVAQGGGARLRYARSVPLGASRLTQRFIRHDPPLPEEMDALHRAARRAWRPVIRSLRRARWRRALGGSAMICQLMTASHRQRHHRPPASVSRLTITQRSLRELVAWLSRSSAAARERLPGLDPRRADQALASAVVLLAWMEGCGVSTLRYAPGSLREGLIAARRLRRSAA
ncbi:MAG: hypothetical protein HYT90_00730 [Candidatus Omnitrophica bacterium]|nr:hypothetical protein [Candidatus Omnitrophota bacterium]